MKPLEEMNEQERDALLKMGHLAEHVEEYEFYETVERLAQDVGYGRMMQIVSYLWRASLQKQGYPPDGALVPTLISRLPGESLRDYFLGYRGDRVFGSFEPDNPPKDNNA